MTFTSRSLAPVLCVAVAGFALSAIGCGGDGVEKYTVPKSTEPTVAKGDLFPRNDKDDPHAGVPGAPPLGAGGGPAAAGGAYRILGAAYPTGQPEWYWYFKFAGPAAQIDAQEANFDALAKSVKFTAGPDAVPAFDTPAGWRRMGPREMSVQGVRISFDEVLQVGGVECTISRAGNGLDSNVKRWVGQVGASNPAVTAFEVNGVAARRIDLRGPNPVGMVRK